MQRFAIHRGYSVSLIILSGKAATSPSCGQRVQGEESCSSCCPSSARQRATAIRRRKIEGFNNIMAPKRALVMLFGYLVLILIFYYSQQHSQIYSCICALAVPMRSQHSSSEEHKSREERNLSGMTRLPSLNT